MIVSRGQRRRDRRGFTLVELFIVGALIALFAGLAIFGVQQQFVSNTRKAVIGETRQLATALDFCNLDTGIFPKLCFLDQSYENLVYLGQQAIPSDNGLKIFNVMDIFSRSTRGMAGGLQGTWKGPYFASSQSRSNVAQGRGGNKQMTLPDYGVVPDGAAGADNYVFRWPGDPYANPYLVYMLNLRATGTGNNYELVFATTTGTLSPTHAGDKGTFINAVVSYGPNQVPGGGAEFRPRPGKDTTTLRLFTGDPNNTAIPLKYIQEADLNTQSGRRKANAWAREYAQNAGSNGDLANMATSSIDPLDTTVIGISDKGSDDIIFSF